MTDACHEPSNQYIWLTTLDRKFAKWCKGCRIYLPLTFFDFSTDSTFKVCGFWVTFSTLNFHQIINGRTYFIFALTYRSESGSGCHEYIHSWFPVLAHSSRESKCFRILFQSQVTMAQTQRYCFGDNLWRSWYFKNIGVVMKRNSEDKLLKYWPYDIHLLWAIVTVLNHS